MASLGAQHLAGPTANHVADVAREAFVAGVSKGLLVAIIASVIGALVALRYLPARAGKAEPAPAAETAAAAVA
jgi:hypothetical protein